MARADSKNGRPRIDARATSNQHDRACWLLLVLSSRFWAGPGTTDHAGEPGAGVLARHAGAIRAGDHALINETARSHRAVRGGGSGGRGGGGGGSYTNRQSLACQWSRAAAGHGPVPVPKTPPARRRTGGLGVRWLRQRSRRWGGEQAVWSAAPSAPQPVSGRGRGGGSALAPGPAGEQGRARAGDQRAAGRGPPSRWRAGRRRLMARSCGGASVGKAGLSVNIQNSLARL